jgi:hypothetical protein
MFWADLDKMMTEPNQKIQWIGPQKGLPLILSLAPPAASPMRRCPYRVHVPVVAAAVGTNQAIGPRCHLLAWAFGPASGVPRVNVALHF